MGSSRQPLKSWQRCFKTAVQGRENASVSGLGIVASVDFPICERIEVYRYAYRARLIGSLEEDFESFLAELGRKRFLTIAEAFVDENPSRFASLAEYGEAFPDYLKRKQRKYRLLSRQLELARIDWKRVLLSNAADPPAIASATVQDIIDRPGAVQLRLNPLTIVHRVRGGKRIHLLWRLGDSVRDRRLSLSEEAVFSLLQRRKQIGLLPVARALKRTPTREVRSVMATLVADGILFSTLV